jgi:hypothetical protein
VSTHFGAGRLALVAGLAAAPVVTAALLAGLDSSGLSVWLSFEIWGAATIAAGAALGRALRPLGTLVAVLGGLGGAVAYGGIVFFVLCFVSYFAITGEGL